MLNHYWFVDPGSELVTFMATQMAPFEEVEAVRIKSLFHAEMLRRFGRV